MQQQKLNLWHYKQLDGGCGVFNDDGDVIMVYPFDNDEKHQSYARLMAAAPDLLISLHTLMLWDSQGHNRVPKYVIDPIIKAMTKATTGE